MLEMSGAPLADPVAPAKGAADDSTGTGAADVRPFTATMITAACTAMTAQPARNHGRTGLVVCRAAEGPAAPRREVPHSPQNLAPAGRIAPQTGHFWVASVMRQS